MNIVYDIDSNTGIMRLKFKDNIFKSSIIKNHTDEYWEKYILPMLAMNSKFVLTGSLSLKLLGIESMSDVGDFDFSLSDNLTEEEYISMKNFFELHDTKDGYGWGEAGEKIKKPYKFNPKDRMWQFSKEYTMTENILDNDLDIFKHFKIDIFNDEIIKQKDIISVYYNDFEIKLVHPSVTLSYRMRYALDNRASTAFKYWEKMKAFMDDAKSYYTNIRAIQKMIMRVYEHNVTLGNNKEKLAYIKNLIQTREMNMDNFFDKVFNAFDTPDILID
jgi:hypothetical protein